MWWFTAVSRDSTSFNTGTTSPPSTPSHLDHILVRMQEVLDQRTHDGLEETAKSGGWQAPYRPEILAELFVISFWISTGWDGYRIKHPKGVSQLKIPRKPLEGDLIRLMIFDGLIALQGGVVEYLRLTAFWEDSINGLGAFKCEVHLANDPEKIIHLWSSVQIFDPW